MDAVDASSSTLPLYPKLERRDTASDGCVAPPRPNESTYNHLPYVVSRPGSGDSVRSACSADGVRGQGGLMLDVSLEGILGGEGISHN